MFSRTCSSFATRWSKIGRRLSQLSGGFLCFRWPSVPRAFLSPYRDDASCAELDLRQISVLRSETGWVRKETRCLFSPGLVGTRIINLIVKVVGQVGGGCSWRPCDYSFRTSLSTVLHTFEINLISPTNALLKRFQDGFDPLVDYIG